MKFSIIIITLNEENYVWKLLDCLKNQAYKDFEVIVVDGNSEDKTVEVVKKYINDLNLKIIESEKRGTSYQRNLGAENASYNNLIFFDADVVIDSDFLDFIVKNVVNENIDYAACAYAPVESGLLYKIFLWFYNNYIAFMQKRQGVATGAFIYSKMKVFKAVGGFDENLNFMEDVDYTKRAFEKGFNYNFYQNPKVKISMRRYEKYGAFKVGFSLLKSEYKRLINNKVKPKMISYGFGKYDEH